MNPLVLSRFVRSLERLYETHHAVERAGGWSDQDAHSRAFEHVKVVGNGAIAELSRRNPIGPRLDDAAGAPIECEVREHHA